MVEKLALDPIRFRLLNETEVDPEAPGRPFSQRRLAECYRIGAERFGWSRRQARPGQVREGSWLVGIGMADGYRNNIPMASGARVRLDGSGMLTVATDRTDIGTGSYRVIARTAAEMMGLTLHRVTVRLGRPMGRPQRDGRRLCRLRQAAGSGRPEAGLRPGQCGVRGRRGAQRPTRRTPSCGRHQHRS